MIEGATLQFGMSQAKVHELMRRSGIAVREERLADGVELLRFESIDWQATAWF